MRLGDTAQFKSKLKAKLGTLNVFDGDNVPAFKTYDNPDDMPDCFIGGPDTGFMEDISLISYSMNAGFFGYTKAEGAKWLADYIAITDKPERVKKLRALHYESLSKMTMVPLVSTVYTALARKPWSIELSQLYANNPLWPVVKK